MSKKVLFIITKSNWGGAQRYVHDLATNLPTDMFSVSVATGGNGVLVEKLNARGIHVISIPHLERDINIKNEILSTLALWSIIEKERPDIIHLNSSKIGGLGALVAFVLKWKLKIASFFNKQTFTPWKIIFTVHGWAFNEDRPRIARYIIRLVQWLTTLLCDSIIIISNRDYRQAIHLPMVNRKKFVLIPLGIPNDSLSFFSKIEARAKLSEKTDTKISTRQTLIGTIAELTRNKGLPYLIGALNHMKSNPAIKNIKVVIIGEGEERKNLQNQIMALGLQNTIILAGFIPDASQYIKAFDIFVLGSLKEGLPYTLIETMHAGAPIIGTRVGGIPDLIEHEIGGIIVPPKNTGALANAIEKLLSDKKLMHKFSKEGEKRVTSKFSFEAMLRHTMALYLQETDKYPQ